MLIELLTIPIRLHVLALLISAEYCGFIGMTNRYIWFLPTEVGIAMLVELLHVFGETECISAVNIGRILYYYLIFFYE